VLIAIIVGGNLAGILGILFAVPVLGTLRVLASYVFHRLYDEDPFVRRRARQERERQRAQARWSRPDVRQRLATMLWRTYEVLRYGWRSMMCWLLRRLGAAGRHGAEECDGEEPDEQAAT
jgi:hypothetical protein